MYSWDDLRPLTVVFHWTLMIRCLPRGCYCDHISINNIMAFMAALLYLLWRQTYLGLRPINWVQTAWLSVLATCSNETSFTSALGPGKYCPQDCLLCGNIKSWLGYKHFSTAMPPSNRHAAVLSQPRASAGWILLFWQVRDEWAEDLCSWDLDHIVISWSTTALVVTLLWKSKCMNPASCRLTGVKSLNWLKTLAELETSRELLL